MFLDPFNSLNSTDLNEKLTLHGHPSSRIIQSGSNKSFAILMNSNNKELKIYEEKATFFGEFIKKTFSSNNDLINSQKK
ncbi:hypothetical protein BpHYR1_012673 [Brachionus plicatilis]|uniref:Uncharacterized protein n=1 Tax=Brachionus plicatilis TaxID=10195 RepID=A0A3M7Q5T3_BRAPC|nr:hypothetical protein BpHYR1_012673 [Brachionus plicatilis]